MHNAGRSVAAKELTEHYGAGRLEVRSAGSEPGDAVNPVLAQVLAERGWSTKAETPKLLTPDTVQAADLSDLSWQAVRGLAGRRSRPSGHRHRAAHRRRRRQAGTGLLAELVPGTD